MRDPRESEEKVTAHEAFKHHYRDVVYEGVIAAVALHFVFFLAFPQLTARDLSVGSRSMEAVELPPQVEIPPPPRRVARPATPRVAEAVVDEETTIAPTTFEENPVEQLPPPPKAGPAGSSERPTFIPRDVEPRAINDAEIQRLLKKKYPEPLRDAGIGGQVVLWIYVNREGRVERAQVQGSSGYESFDRAARDVALQMQFRPALNRDQPIGVWVQRAINFSVEH